ncbi:FAD-dependent oxidoreductase [Streptomyces sp. G-G2]|uniref:FAD-dependent oxidoreductase n=1 Tax=Streptomyces sp. G-G2 TaxID=3046201 RepID=UPI0024BB1FC6|nr:FAD-dependent oxidoreductase [Streptomyces sp. G-G2]MDJ0380372.1 FAD-dependent oxidoreductase [Streptomyces sp. G-G2]
MPKRHAVVVGAGIGGLTAALALHRRGWDVTVLERAPEPPAAGAGIGLAPNALRALDAIGVDAARALGGAVPTTMGVRRPDGLWLTRTRTADMVARYGVPPTAVPRPAFTAALAAALPPRALRYGTAVTAVDGAAGRPTVRTAIGQDLRADLVVAADGIHSPLRRAYFPAHPGLRYTGETAWRTIVDAPDLRVRDMSETLGRGERFGVTPLSDGRLYLYATAVVPAGTRSADPRDELRRRFGSWHDPIPALLDHVGRLGPADVLQNDLYDLAAPLPSLHRGRIAWLGDAAHAMAPNLGQGGCQAIEDAVVLAHLLPAGEREGGEGGEGGADDAGSADDVGSADPVLAALAAYTDARRDRTDAVRVRARRVGRMGALRNPLAVAARDLAVRAVPARLALRGMDDLFNGFHLPARQDPAPR